MNYDSEVALRKGEIEQLAKMKDYATDLNAIREAVCSLRPEEANKWVQELLRIVEFGANPHWLPDYHIANATSEHRTEAFLKMKGLWKDGVSE